MLKQRLLSSAVIVPILIAGLLFAPFAIMVGVLIIISTVAILEFYKVLDRADIPSFQVLRLSPSVPL